MAMWGAGSNKGKKKRVEKDSVGFNKPAESSNKDRFGIEKPLKYFFEYSEEEQEYYDSIVDLLEPASKSVMIRRLIGYGFPPSYVFGTYGVVGDESEWNGVERMCWMVEEVRKKTEGKVLLVTENEKERDLVNYIVDGEVEVIETIDHLVQELEGAEEAAVWFGLELPEEFIGSLDMLVEPLEGIEGIHIIEMGEDEVFDTALHIKDWEDVNKKGKHESDVSLDYLEELIYEEEEEEEDREEEGEGEDRGQDDYSDLFEWENEKEGNVEKEESTDKENNKEEEESVEEYEDKDTDEKLFELEEDEQEENEEETVHGHGEIVEDEYKKLEEAYDNLNNEYEIIKEQLREIKEEYESKEIDFNASDQLLVSKNKEIEKKEDQIKEKEEEIDELQKKIEEIDTGRLSFEDEEILKDKVVKLEERNEELERKIKNMKTEVKKAYLEVKAVKESYEELSDSYKSLQKGVSVSDYQVMDLEEGVESRYVYFKVWNQPPYFRSFMKSFMRVLGKGRTIKLVALLEDTEKNDMYFSDWEKVQRLGESNGDGKCRIIPSKFMFEGWEEIDKDFDLVVVIDYTGVGHRLVRGEGVTTVNVMLNEEEKNLLGVKGMVLAAGENSIVDMRYDSVYEGAPTSYVRDRYMDKKVREWVKMGGLL